MLNLYHLKYFFDAVQTSSLTKAAEINLVSPSAISQSIRQLESSLNCKLIDHKKNSFQLTIEGRSLHERAGPILVGISQLQSEIKNSNHQSGGPFSIATTHSLASLFAIPILSKMHDQHSNFWPKVKIGGTSYILQMVEKREADLGFAMEDGTKTSLGSALVRSGQFKLFVRKNRQKLTLKDQKFWLTNPDFEGLGFAEQFAARFGQPPHWAFPLESWTLVANMVENGFGVGILPDFFMISHPQLTVIKSDFKMQKYSLRFYFRKRETMSKNMNLFLKSLCTQLE